MTVQVVPPTPDPPARVLIIVPPPVPGWLALAVEVALVEVTRVVGVEVLPLVLLVFH